MTTPLDLGILVGLAYQSFCDDLRAALEGAGFDDLGGAYGYVFRALDAEPLRLNVLAERLGMTMQGAGKIIDEMEGRGYVERRPDPADGRAKGIALAPRGRTALATARRFHASYERRLARTLGGRGTAELRRGLDAMVAATGTEAAHARLRAP